MLRRKWQDYFGSNKEFLKLVKEEGNDKFERNILIFCPNKKLLTYYENKLLYQKGVIEPDSVYVNDNIQGRFFPKDFFEDEE